MCDICHFKASCKEANYIFLPGEICIVIHMGIFIFESFSRVLVKEYKEDTFWLQVSVKP